MNNSKKTKIDKAELLHKKLLDENIKLQLIRENIKLKIENNDLKRRIKNEKVFAKNNKKI